MSEPSRRVLVVVNPRRPEAIDAARRAVTDLGAAGIEVCLADDDAQRVEDPTLSALPVVPADEHAADGCEVVLVLGGDGTILRGAERARAASVPILGINLGHVGFLAEAEADDVHSVVASIVQQTWHVEERLVLDLVVQRDGQPPVLTWALNDVSIERHAHDRMLDVLVEVDGRPLSRWGCDGVVLATPTGSTAYAFSGGGPVVWPEVAALVVVPLAAHALFSRPLVVSPRSTVAFELQPTGAALISADGRRTIAIEGAARIEVRAGRQPVRLARLVDAPFTDRLVAKFALPVEGWRGGRR